MQSKAALCFTLPAAQWVSSFQKQHKHSVSVCGGGDIEALEIFLQNLKFPAHFTLTSECVHPLGNGDS